MKKFLLSAPCTLPLLFVHAFASPVSLSLFQDGFSILDKLFLCGAGIILLGAILLIVAFCKSSSKKEKPVDSPFDAYLEEDGGHSEDSISEDDIPEDEECSEFEEDLNDTSNAAEDPVETLEEEPNADEGTISQTEEDLETDEPEDETIYPKLILTHTQSNDFVILPLYPQTTVGRKTDNDLVLSDVTVSGLHCRILNEDGAIYVLDEESTNGTFINDERLTEKTQLHHGDKLTIGKQEFNVSVSE